MNMMRSIRHDLHPWFVQSTLPRIGGNALQETWTVCRERVEGPPVPAADGRNEHELHCRQRQRGWAGAGWTIVAAVAGEVRYTLAVCARLHPVPFPFRLCVFGSKQLPNLVDASPSDPVLPLDFSD